jgi:hypothetical protein
MKTTVQTLWLRSPLTLLARVSLASYVRYGCKVTLWTYGLTAEDAAAVPEGVGVQDALEIMPEAEVHRHAYAPTGQLALGCDRVLWTAQSRMGGWAGHLDATLMRPLDDIAEPYAFGPHHAFPPSQAIWKAPRDSVYVRAALAFVADPPHMGWYDTMKAANRAFEKYGLVRFMRDDLVDDDRTEEPIRHMLRAPSLRSILVMSDSA